VCGYSTKWEKMTTVVDTFLWDCSKKYVLSTYYEYQVQASSTSGS